MWLKTGLNLTFNFLDQNNLKSKHQGKNELVYIRDEHVWTVAEINPLSPERELKSAANTFN